MKHSEIRQRIIETASFLFYKNGYNTTGINEIISETGIAKATLYNHFKSKEDICITYLKYKNSTFIKNIGTYCKSKTVGRDQILALFDFLLEFFKNKDFNGCWCIKTVSEIPKDNTKIRNEIKLQKDNFLQLISDLIKNNIKDLSNTKAKTITKQVYLMYESAVAESHLHQKDWPIKEAKKVCAKII